MGDVGQQGVCGGLVRFGHDMAFGGELHRIGTVRIALMHGRIK